MKNIFKILMVFALFLAIPISATSLEKEKDNKIETSIDIQINTVSLQINFVNLSMERKQAFNNYFDEVTPIDLDVINNLPASKFVEFPIKIDYTKNQKSLLNYKSIQDEALHILSKNFNQKKTDLLEARIKEYLPDFDITDLSEENTKNFYKCIDGDETHYFLKHKEKDIRLITFVKIEKPINFSPDNYTASITIEESYY